MECPENDESTSTQSTPPSSLGLVNQPMVNKIKERLLILSPTVQAGLERECNKTDFFREGDKFIGKGGFGEVRKVIYKSSNNLYVIKVIDKTFRIKTIDQMNREIEIM